MRSLRPLFARHARRGDLEASAERLKNRDWVEFLQVVHPSQAESAEREYILARLKDDWGSLTSALLATHSQPTAIKNGNLLVLCDHNTFANELSLVAQLVEKKIAARYDQRIRIHVRVSQRIDWNREPRAVEQEPNPVEVQKISNPALDRLIGDLEKYLAL